MALDGSRLYDADGQRQVGNGTVVMSAVHDDGILFLLAAAALRRRESLAAMPSKKLWSTLCCRVGGDAGKGRPDR